MFIKYCVFSKISKFKIYLKLKSRFPLGVSMCAQWQRLQQNLQSSEKSHFKEKHNI